jgi:AbrB family looped-hinge helix DNA binding protein
MVEMRVNRDKNGRTSFYVPSFIRDKHNLQNGDIVDVDTKGNKIIVTIKKA